MKICGLHSGHDCSFAILEDGQLTIHHELERFSRIKLEISDAAAFLFDVYVEYDDIDYFTFVIMNWQGGIKKRYPESYKKLEKIVNNNILLTSVGHHQAHAAGAFFSSNYKKAIVITIDGGGDDRINGVGPGVLTSAFTVWYGKNNKLFPLEICHIDKFNIGGIWQKHTKNTFGLSIGCPLGSQEGIVMAMAAFGDENKYGFDKIQSSDFYRGEIDKNEENKFHIAASIQRNTENQLREKIKPYMEKYTPEVVCISGGVAMNSVMMGKVYEWFPCIKKIYIPPAPYDAGLAVGSAQYLWHHVQDNPRIKWVDNYSPYTGYSYNKEIIEQTMLKKTTWFPGIFKEKPIKSSIVTEDYVIDLLNEQKIISVYGGKSESGRRALGNRSILADPRQIEMKDKINEKVKHRQWFRPFAPSILREDVKDWFVRDIDSPYMSFVVKFKEDMKNKVPAVVHKDDTARLQTVTENDNRWYYNFLKKWKEKTGIPILLNTSFNDREPIVETPEHAINCFLGTNIDYLYFYEYKILVERK